jgi:hypothetical protein
MASAQVLRRIAAVRRMEEDLQRRALDTALGELSRMELALQGAKERERAGRGLIQKSAANGEVLDRIAGMEESRSAARQAAALKDKIRVAEAAVAKLRQEYLDRRTRRLQAETLAEREQAREAREQDRRSQQSLDDWYLGRMVKDSAEK